MSPSPYSEEDLFHYLLQLGDDRLILGHRLSEWCGHSHDLEDDIALANIALDLIGQAENFLRAAGDCEGSGRDENKLVYFRDALQYENCLLVELPRGDFGFTVCRALLFDLYSTALFSALKDSNAKILADLAARCLKEASYHLRYSKGWFLRLGDGTEESHSIMQSHLNYLWPYTGELFIDSDLELRLSGANVTPLPSTLKEGWLKSCTELISAATLDLPERSTDIYSGGRYGRHTEHLGFLLSELQILPRSYPDAVW